MRTEELHIAAVASALPDRVRTADALASGQCDRRVAEQTGIVSVSVSETASAAELAAEAAVRAMRRSGVPPEDLRIVLHADVHYQGHDLWAPASHVQDAVGGSRCPAVEIRQLSNGGMAGLELAAHVLRGQDSPAAALVTTGDTFGMPGFDRWRSDPGTVYGDGGTAAVLTNHGGFAVVRSVATVSDPTLERMHRGDDPFGRMPFSVRAPMDLEVLKRDYLASAGVGAAVRKVVEGQRDALTTALKDAEADLSGIDWFVLPHFGLRRLTAGYLKAWDIDLDATTWPWGRTIGHLGAGDQFAGLEQLVLSGRARPGQRLLFAGVGAGFSWSCAVAELTAVPAEWEPAPRHQPDSSGFRPAEPRLGSQDHPAGS
ncbi:ketoacyl-ACP synthase III family protein [Amycolatopsis thermoflava]|uniref:ketoacyl-ACP synthase III family protein n=1 Tax=Amycolatopsis thermoflava TaxID=84480 RepID=UPI0004069907|nr:ketoacyl-ACP synthase III family protein [Amycolatopsis thermoflava]